jgi:hypothetical protein
MSAAKVGLTSDPSGRRGKLKCEGWPGNDGYGRNEVDMTLGKPRDVARGKRLLTLVLIISTMTACSSAGGAHFGDSGTSTAPSSTMATVATSTADTASTSTTDSAGSPFAKVGGTLALSLNAAHGVGRPAFNVTLNQVIDPAPIQVPNHVAPKDQRFVEMEVTIANVGKAVLPVRGGYLPDVVGFTWYLNPSYTTVDLGLQFTQDFPSATCKGVPQEFAQDLAPGQSLTGCVQFGPLSDSIGVTGFEAELQYGGHGNEFPGIWRIS